MLDFHNNLNDCSSNYYKQLHNVYKQRGKIVCPIYQKIERKESIHNKIKQRRFLQLFLKSEISFQILNKTNVS